MLKMKRGQKFELEDGLKCELEDGNYHGEYDEDVLQEAIEMYQDDMMTVLPNEDYDKICGENDFFTIDTALFDAGDVVLEGIVTFPAYKERVPNLPLGKTNYKPAGVFIPFQNFDKVKVIFDDEGKIVEEDKPFFREILKPLKEACKNQPYKNVEQLVGVLKHGPDYLKKPEIEAKDEQPLLDSAVEISKQTVSLQDIETVAGKVSKAAEREENEAPEPEK